MLHAYSDIIVRSCSGIVYDQWQFEMQCWCDCWKINHLIWISLVYMYLMKTTNYRVTTKKERQDINVCSERGSNPRPWDYETHALPTALSERRGIKSQRVRPGSNRWPQDLQSYALPLSYAPIIYWNWKHARKCEQHWVPLLAILAAVCYHN